MKLINNIHLNCKITGRSTFPTLAYPEVTAGNIENKKFSPLLTREHFQTVLVIGI